MIQIANNFDKHRSVAGLSVTNKISGNVNSEAHMFWGRFGFLPGSSEGRGVIPHGVVALETRDEKIYGDLWHFLKRERAQSLLIATSGEADLQFFATGKYSLSDLRQAVPDGVIVHWGGQ